MTAHLHKSIGKSIAAGNAIRNITDNAISHYYFFVANETSPFLAGVFEAVFGTEKGWKKNETNRRTLAISEIRQHQETQ